MAQQSTIPAPFFKQPKPLGIRLWHWLAFLFFLSSVTTVIFASTLFRTRNNVGMVQQQVQEKGGTITPDQARSVAHEYSDKLWMLHKYFGFGLSFLVLWRIIAEAAASKEKRLLKRIKAASTYPAGGEKQHYLLVQYGYVVFYSMFFIMALTGLVLAFEDIQWLDPVHNTAKQIHSITQWGLYAYMLLHIFGVIRADVTKYGGIISAMVNGKTIPAE